MSRRHAHNRGDWHSVAARLDEIMLAASGDDPLEEACRLLLAGVCAEREGERLFAHAPTPARVDHWLARVRARWPSSVDDQPTRLGAPVLARCAEVLRDVPLLESGLVALDAVFEAMVSRSARGRKGQFFTPRTVVQAAVELVAPAPGERVVDPACGSGAFLSHAVAARAGVEVVGCDNDTRAVRVARAMMAALDVAPTCVRRLDSLSRAPGERLEDHVGAGFDVVLSNPPFAGDIGRAHADGYALAKNHRVERDVLFLERAVELLRPGGRLAIVLPHNKVAGEAFGFVREWLLRQVRVVAVVGLPRETFLPHTAQKACLVVGQKRASALPAVAADERVLLHVSDRAGKDAQGRPITLPDAPRSAAPWDALDHDLRDAVHAVREHLVEHPWA